jgi:hypothetical protein
MKHLPLAVNLLAYQCAWLACVLGAAHQRPLIGLVVAGTALLLHLAWASAPRRELPLIATAVAIGAVFETVLVASGWVRVDESLLVASSTPLLMVVLWAVFATTLNVALRSLRSRYLLCSLLAAIAAPLAYRAGAQLGALEMVEIVPALVLVSLSWAVLLPLLMRTALRFDGMART